MSVERARPRVLQDVEPSRDAIVRSRARAPNLIGSTRQVALYAYGAPIELAGTTEGAMPFRRSPDSADPSPHRVLMHPETPRNSTRCSGRIKLFRRSSPAVSPREGLAAAGRGRWRRDTLLFLFGAG